MTASAPEPAISVISWTVGASPTGSVPATQGATDGGYFLVYRDGVEPSASITVPYEIDDANGDEIGSGSVSLAADAGPRSR